MSFEILTKQTENGTVNYINFLSPLMFQINGQTIANIISKKDHLNSLFPKGIIAKIRNGKIIIKDKFGELINIIFDPPIKVIYKNVGEENKEFIDEEVYSLNQIESILEFYKIQKPYFMNNENINLYYFDSKGYLIRNFYSELTIINYEKIYELKENETLLGDDNIFQKLSLSKYFDEYFVYPENEENFEFFHSKKRDDILFNIEILKINKSPEKPITQFKISGPSSEGKSITLLYASRLYMNIIYLNLKVIIKSYLEKKEYLDLLIYEFGRLQLMENDKKSFEKIFNENCNKNPWELFEILCFFLKDKNVILIFDQFQDKYVSQISLGVIKSYLNSQFKIIISSSINDKEIGDKIADSIYKNKGCPQILYYENQDDYFYYCDLINEEDLIKMKLVNSDNYKKYQLFNFEPKYIKLLNITTEEEIRKHIIQKMKEHCEKLGIDFELYIFNIYSKIGKKINYEILNLKTISLKYCKLIFEKESFTIKYKFKFIEQIIEEKIKQMNIKDYFDKKKYNDSELYKSLKGYFFEYASIKDLKTKKLFKDNPIKYNLQVKTIIGMEQPEDGINLDVCSSKTIKYGELLKSNLSLIKKININNTNLKNDNNENKTNNDMEIDNDEYNNNIESIFNKECETEINRINTLLGKKRNKEEEEMNKDKKVKESKKKKEVKNVKKEKVIDLDKSVNYIEYKEDFKNGSIMITQKQLNGEAVDLGFLFGKQYEKKFIGLQIKFYDNKTHLKTPITKKLIKKQIKPLLINCLKKLGIKIKEWHYIMVLYYNKDEDNEYNKSIINNCKNHNIYYIYFDPSKNEFYDRNKNLLVNLDTNFMTNIDFNTTCNPYHFLKDTDFIEKYLEQTNNESINKINLEDIFNESSTEIISDLKSILNNDNFKDNYEIKIIGRFILIEEYNFPVPQNLYCLLFQSKNKKLLFYYNINNELKCKEKDNQTIIKPSFISNYVENYKKSLNDKKDKDIYFYVLKIFK